MKIDDPWVDKSDEQRQSSSVSSSDRESHHTCPACGSVHVRRSGRKNILERRILPVLSIHPYRCDECDTRFYGRVQRNHTDKNKAA